MQASEFNALLVKTFRFHRRNLSAYGWTKSLTFYSKIPFYCLCVEWLCGDRKIYFYWASCSISSSYGISFGLDGSHRKSSKSYGSLCQQKGIHIHKQIYFTKNEGGSGMQFTLKPNKYKNTLFVVDEASMIGDDRQNTKLLKTVRYWVI